MTRQPALRAVPDGADELDLAIDALASVLGAMSHAASSETGAVRLAGWQRHILVLEPPPGESRAEPVTHRVWSGARTAAVGWVREETGERERKSQELQDTLWALVKGLTNTLNTEAATDAETAACIERLRNIGTLSPNELQAVVTEAVGRLAEILERRRAEHEETAASLAARIQSLSTDLESARRDADLDPLTQLANRGAFDRELDRAVDLQALTRDPTALILVDLDNLKQINDTRGHTGGDEGLKAVANALVRAFPRRSDLVARYGGDEFAVLLQNAGEADAVRLVGRLYERIAEANATAEIPVSVSAGIAALHPSRTAKDVLEAADGALYRAKADGKGRAVVDGAE